MKKINKLNLKLFLEKDNKTLIDIFSKYFPELSEDDIHNLIRIANFIKLTKLDLSLYRPTKEDEVIVKELKDLWNDLIVRLNPIGLDKLIKESKLKNLDLIGKYIHYFQDLNGFHHYMKIKSYFLSSEDEVCINGMDLCLTFTEDEFKKFNDEKILIRKDPFVQSMIDNQIRVPFSEIDNKSANFQLIDENIFSKKLELINEFNKFILNKKIKNAG